MLIPGDTFYLAATVRPDDGHLYFIVATDEIEGSLILNFTTHGSDRTCIVKPKEHPWVTELTLVAYERAKDPLTKKELEVLERIGIDRRDQPLSDALLRRVQE